MACLWIACLFTALIFHGLGHAAVARLLGQDVTLHLAHVDHVATTPTDRALIAAAGPALFLAQGVWLVWRGGLPVLVALMLGGLGFATAFGYLLTTPFTDRGDMGVLAVLRGWPTIWRIAIAIAAGAALTVLARQASSGHLAMLPPGWRGLTTPTALAVAVILPWALAMLLVIWAITFRPGLFSALYPLFAGSYLLIGWLDRPNWSAPTPVPGATDPPMSVSAALAAAALALALFLRRT